ncbi:MAG TPA: hypothetical protein VJR58_07030 [Vineibacter sp.]|nr:hypothetical protein [Vineibacter sp.]
MLAFGMAPAVRAKDTIDWKELDGWRIVVDRSLKDGCFMLWIGERGTIVRIGFNDDRRLYWMLGHSNWKSLERGKRYRISVNFDGASPFNGDMTGFQLGDTMLLFVAIDRAFLEQFMRSHSMDVAFGDRPVASIKLRGSYAAGEEMLYCQASIDGNRPSSGSGGRDPFATSPGSAPSRDPFR